MKRRRSSRVRFGSLSLPASAAPEWVNPPEGTAAPIRQADRKLLQLCSQVAETLEQVLAEQEEDDLRDLQVASVEPAPDGSHLLVTVRSLASGADPTRLMGELNEASARLRAEVTSAITRRRAPSLTFRVVPPGASV